MTRPANGRAGTESLGAWNLGFGACPVFNGDFADTFSGHQMQRSVEPEWLDELPTDDPRAMRSRRDLQRIHSWMGNVGIMARLLRNVTTSEKDLRVAELGAGDGDRKSVV